MTPTTTTVLFVDDDEAILSLGRVVLERAGHTVVTARTGPEALERYAASVPRASVVVLDLHIPGLDGVAVLRSLHANHGPVPVLLSTGMAAAEVMESLDDASVAGILAKPYSPADLVNAVAEILRTDHRRAA